MRPSMFILSKSLTSKAFAPDSIFGRDIAPKPLSEMRVRKLAANKQQLSHSPTIAGSPVREDRPRNSIFLIALALLFRIQHAFQRGIEHLEWEFGMPQFLRLSRLLLSMATHLGGLLAFVPSNSAQAVFPVKFSAEQL